MGSDDSFVSFKWLETEPASKKETWFSSSPIKIQPAEIKFITPECTGDGGPVYYSGMSFKLKAFDEFADYPSKEGETVPPKKTFGKWVPTRKNGKLVADGGVVQRNDSGEPDVDWVTTPKSKLDELFWNLANQSKPIKLDPGKISWTPLTNPKKQQQATGPVAALNGAQAAYNKLVQQAKNTNLHIELFKKNIKPLTHALSLSIPEQIAKLLEKQAVEDYSKHFAIYNAAEEEVK